MDGNRSSCSSKQDDYAFSDYVGVDWLGLQGFEIEMIGHRTGYRDMRQAVDQISRLEKRIHFNFIWNGLIF